MVAEPLCRENRVELVEQRTTRRPRNLSLSKSGIGAKKNDRFMRRSMSCDELAMCRNRARSPVVVGKISSCYKENRSQVNDGRDMRKRSPRRKTRSNRCRSNSSKDRDYSKENSPNQTGRNGISTACYCVEKLTNDRKTSIKNLISFPTNSLLFSAVVEGDIELVQRLLLDDTSAVNKLGLEGTAPIHEAAINGDLECLELLIKCGADLEIKDKCDRTALEYAVFAGNFDCAAFLLTFGANDEKIRDGFPCL